MLLTSFAEVIARPFTEVAFGGAPYSQGDWVINFGDGPVRRGGLAACAPLIFLSLARPASTMAAGALLALSAALFALALLGSGINIFFLPFLAAIAFVTAPRPQAMTFLAVIAASALASPVFTALHPAVSDPGVVCARLTERGLGAHFCEGSIAWLEKGSSGGLAAVRDMASAMHLARTLAAVAAALSLIAVVLLANGWSRRGVAWLCASLIEFLPLFVVAVDWGRWLNMGVFSVVTLAMPLTISRRHPRVDAPAVPLGPERWYQTLLLALACTVWAITNRGTLMIDGSLLFKAF